MFSINWLRGAAPIASEVTTLTDIQRVIEFARTQAVSVCRRYPGEAPTSFQISNASGEFTGVFPI